MTRDACACVQAFEQMKTTTVDISVHQRLLDQVCGLRLACCCLLFGLGGLLELTREQVKEERAGYASRIDETTRSYKEELAGRQRQVRGGGGGGGGGGDDDDDDDDVK